MTIREASIMRRPLGVALWGVVAAGALVLGFAVPANAWGTTTLPLSGCTGHANVSSTYNNGSGRHLAYTDERGNFCPGGQQLLSVGLLRSNGVADAVVSGYTQVVTTHLITSIYTGGRHTAGGASTIT